VCFFFSVGIRIHEMILVLSVGMIVFFLNGLLCFSLEVLSFERIVVFLFVVGIIVHEQIRVFFFCRIFF